MLACERQNREILEKLIERGADVHSLDKNGWPAFLYCCHDVVKIETSLSFGKYFLEKAKLDVTKIFLKYILDNRNVSSGQTKKILVRIWSKPELLMCLLADSGQSRSFCAFVKFKKSEIFSIFG
jgi:hypothetical protein